MPLWLKLYEWARSGFTFWPRPRPMIGLLAQLTPEQRAKAFSYTGKINSTDEDALHD